MGWKTLKEAFGIEKHIVCVTDKGICIGSGYVHDLVTIDTQTGRVRESEAFGGFLRQSYPALEQASPEELLSLIQAQDCFSASIPVFTYEGSLIIEKCCEATGWPNVTHDGDLIYENTYSTDKNVVIGWAKRNAQLQAKCVQEGIERLRDQLDGMQSRLAEAQAWLATLDTDHPSVPAAG